MNKKIAVSVLIVLVVVVGIYYINLPKPGEKIDVPYTVVEDDPEIESAITTTYIEGGNLIIEFVSDVVPTISGLADGTYTISDNEAVVFNYDGRWFRLIFGDSSDIYEFGTEEDQVTYPENSMEFQHGLWYSPYIKIYSLGGDDRIVEVSTYPRAYIDTDPHVYKNTVKFIVTEDDLNFEINGERVHMDSREDIYYLGEWATHWIDDSLPGAFPLWIESEELPFNGDGQYHIFPVSAIPGQILDVSTVTVKIGETYVEVSVSQHDAVRTGLIDGEIVLPYLFTERVILRIQYKRVI